MFFNILILIFQANKQAESIDENLNNQPPLKH